MPKIRLGWTRLHLHRGIRFSVYVDVRTTTKKENLFIHLIINIMYCVRIWKVKKNSPKVPPEQLWTTSWQNVYCSRSSLKSLTLPRWVDEENDMCVFDGSLLLVQHSLVRFAMTKLDYITQYWSITSVWFTAPTLGVGKLHTNNRLITMGCMGYKYL